MVTFPAIFSPSILAALRTLGLIIIFITAFNLLLKYIRRALLRHVHTKNQRTNVEIFIKVLKYVFFVLVIIFALFSYAGSWTGFGLGVGFLSAALGWALQKPITGIAAWIMIIVNKPFVIGDRIIVGGVRGDVTNITLTHIFLREIGGIVPGEENSGRIILVPNSTLFEKEIINYTLQGDYVLDQVITSVTYESDLKKSMRICLSAAKKHTTIFAEQVREGPYVRTFFQPSGINVHVRYYAPASRLQEFTSLITQEIFEKIRHTKDVDIAYPHTEIIYRQKS